MADGGVGTVRNNTVGGAGSSASPPSSASDLVARATNPGTGVTDTRALARMVADAHRQDPDAASSAYTGIEQQLGARNLGDVGRFNEDLRAEFGGGLQGDPAALAGSAVFGAGQGATVAGGRIAAQGYRALVDNPILSIRWESTTSAVTGRGGFTSNLQDMLRNNGIEVSPRVNAVPPGSVTPANLVQSGQAANLPQARGLANNTNGAAAETAIRNRYIQQGHQVDPGPTRVQGGARVVDVTVQVPNAADPRNAQRIEIESKVGRTNMGTPRVQQEAAMDAARLAENQAVRRGGAALEAAGSTLRTAGRILRPVGIAMDVYSIGTAFHEDGNRIGVNTGRAISTTAGGIAGAAGGAAVGAAIGSVVPVVGTAIGGIVGGIVGGLGGSELASRGFDWVRSLF